MTLQLRVIALAAGLLYALAGFAQTPAPTTVPPAKTSPSIGSAVTPVAKPAVDPTAQPKTMSAAKNAVPATAAAGGGDGKV